MLFAVKLRSVLVTHGHSLDLSLVDIDEVAVFLLTFILQDIDFILQDFDTLFHFSQVLTTCLDLTNVLVSRILYFFVKSNESIEFEVSILLLLGQIKNQKFFDL